MRGDGDACLCKSKSPKTYEVKGDLMNRKMVEGTPTYRKTVSKPTLLVTP